MTSVVKKIVVPTEKRPICKTSKCKNKSQHMGRYDKDGYPLFRSYCIKCHNERRLIFQEKASQIDRRSVSPCKVPGCKKKCGISGTDHYGNIKFTVFCKEHAGLSNSYLLFRKDYCENIDSRLGFKCTTNVHWKGMLDVDHINGNPFDNREENFQTLCKCCHSYKSNVNKDYITPGRKTLRENKKS